MKHLWGVVGCLLLFFGTPALAGLAEGMFCPEVYQPVCGLVQVECVTAPCDPVPETFSNSCYLQNDTREVRYLYNGECDESRVTVAQTVHEQLADLSPVDPVLGGSRYVVELQFVADNQVAVTYEDGHIQESLTATYYRENEQLNFTVEQAQQTGNEASVVDTTGTTTDTHQPDSIDDEVSGTKSVVMQWFRQCSRWWSAVVNWLQSF